MTDNRPECKSCESTNLVIIYAEYVFGDKIYYYLCTEHRLNLGLTTKEQYDEWVKVSRKSIMDYPEGDYYMDNTKRGILWNESQERLKK